MQKNRLSFLLVSKIFTRCSEEFSPEFPSMCQAGEIASNRNVNIRKFQTNAHCAHIDQFDKLCNESKALGLLCRPSGQHTLRSLTHSACIGFTVHMIDTLRAFLFPSGKSSVHFFQF